MEGILVFRSGVLVNRKITVHQGHGTILGRDSGCDVCIREVKVSRHHAEIYIENGLLFIKDLDSRNGIFVNGKEVQRSILRRGDNIIIGDSVLEVVQEPQVQNITTASGRLVSIKEVPDLENKNDYRNLFNCLLKIQKILSENDEFILERSLETLFNVLPASRLAILTVDDDGEIEQGYTITQKGPTDDYIGRSFARKVLESGKAILMEDTQASEVTDLGSTIDEQNIRSILGVPIFRKNETVGVLLCDNRVVADALGESHLQLLEMAGRMLEAVFERKTLRDLESRQLAAEREMTIAKRVQKQLFTKKADNISGNMLWSVYYSPALEIGGDFYDFHQYEDRTFWIIADVSNKGVSAALVVSMVKAFCKELYEHNLQPCEFLKRVNELIRDEIPSFMFLTAMAFQVNTEGVLEYANAGHPGLVRIPAGPDRTPEVQEITPGVIGMGPADTTLTKVETKTVQLNPGDRICVYTDGLPEAGGGEDQLGDQAVWDLLAETADFPPERAVRNVIDSVRDHQGVEQFDDITLIIGEYRPLDPRPTERYEEE